MRWNTVIYLQDSEKRYFKSQDCHTTRESTQQCSCSLAQSWTDFLNAKPYLPTINVIQCSCPRMELRLHLHGKHPKPSWVAVASYFFLDAHAILCTLMGMQLMQVFELNKCRHPTQAHLMTSLNILFMLLKRLDALIKRRQHVWHEWKLQMTLSREKELSERIRVGSNVRTQPPPPAPVSLEVNLNFNVVRKTVSMEAWLTPMHCSKPWFISINSPIFSSVSVIEMSSGAGAWIIVNNSLLIESTALNTEVMASGCLKALSETPATKAFVFLPTFVLVMSILRGTADLMRVKLPDLNLIMLPAE